MNFLNQLWIVLGIAISTICGIGYARNSGKKEAKAEANANLLDDIITAKKISADVDATSNNEISERLRRFQRRLKD